MERKCATRLFVKIMLFVFGLVLLTKGKNVYAASQQGDSIYFGYYPQELVKKSEIVSMLNGYNDDKFNSDNVIEVEGTKYQKKGNNYYVFKPIKWNVLSNSDDTFTLISEKVLDAHNFSSALSGTASIKWANSDLRTWLNDEFYNRAFSTSEQADIKSTLVSTPPSLSGLSGGDDTIDKVYLLSMQEYLSVEYGFSSSYDQSTTREAQYVSGFSLTTPHSGDINSEKGTCYYWTRSVGQVQYGLYLQPYWVSCNGSLTVGGRVYSTWRLGVRPVIKVLKSSNLWSETEPKVEMKIPAEKAPNVKATSIVLNSTSIKIAPKGTWQLSATFEPANVSNKSVSWKSSDTKVATVSSTGLVRAGEKGTATITATTNDGSKKSATCKITIKNEYKIVYFLGKNGKNSSKNPTTYDGSKAIKLSNPTRKGYTFKGWYTSSSYKTKVTQIKKGSRGQVDLFAKWEMNTYKITYKLNGGKNNSKNRTTYTVKTGAITLKKPSKEGYNFKGWYTNSGFKPSSKIEKIPGDYLKNVTLYAKWNKNALIITYNGNNNTGGNTPATTQIYYNKTKKVEKNTFIRTGYKFKGWKGNNGKNYNAGDKIKNTSKANKTLVLKARWEANTYTVKFNGNGASSGSMKEITCTYDQEKVLPQNAFKKDGYVFTGWVDSNDSKGDVRTDRAKVKNLATGGSVILTAQWEIIDKYPNISYNLPTPRFYQYDSGDRAGDCAIASIAIYRTMKNNGKSASENYEEVWQTNHCRSYIQSWAALGLTPDTNTLLENIYEKLKVTPVIIHRQRRDEYTHFSVIYAYVGNGETLEKSGFLVYEVNKEVSDAKLTETLEKWDNYNNEGSLVKIVY